MPLGTLDRSPPPFFRQGPSALTKLALCSALALLLMVADARFKLMQPARAVLALRGAHQPAPVAQPLSAFDEIDDETIDAACVAGGIYRVDLMRAYNVLRAHPAKITTRVDGIAASAAFGAALASGQLARPSLNSSTRLSPAPPGAQAVGLLAASSLLRRLALN